jgi:hypothetical protein
MLSGVDIEQNHPNFNIGPTNSSFNCLYFKLEWLHVYNLAFDEVASLKNPWTNTHITHITKDLEVMVILKS